MHLLLVPEEKKTLVFAAENHADDGSTVVNGYGIAASVVATDSLHVCFNDSASTRLVKYLYYLISVNNCEGYSDM